MLISFGDFRVDARDLDDRPDSGALGMLAIDIDRASELVKFTSSGTEKMPQLKGDLRMRRVELIRFTPDR